MSEKEPGRLAFDLWWEHAGPLNFEKWPDRWAAVAREIDGGAIYLTPNIEDTAPSLPAKNPAMATMSIIAHLAPRAPIRISCISVTCLET
jgi:hypothetical protein